MTRHVRAPTIGSAYGRSDASPEWTIGKRMPKSSVTTCELPPAIDSRAAVKSSPYPVAG